MIKSHKRNWALIMVVAASLACAIPALPTSSTNEVSTAAAQNEPQEAPSATLEILPTPTFTPTVTSAPLNIAGTVTPSLTFTPYSIFAATTPTFVTSSMSVSAPTNCRSGPGKSYGVEGTLKVGEMADVYGRDPTSEYLYIRNPDPGVEFCWVWGEYATISSSLFALPVLMPPPTPSPTLTETPVPSFDMEFIGYIKCAGWRIKILITNTSAQSFKSAKVVVKDEVTEVELTADLEDFTELNNCQPTATKDMIKSGETFLISSPQFDTNPRNHQFRAFITLCTEKQQSGGCITRKINFKP